MPVGHVDPRVDAYIEGLPAWQRDAAQTIRRLVHRADPEVMETIKRSVQPYFVLDGNICALLGTKDHLNVFIYDPIAPDPHGLITSASTIPRRAASRSGRRTCSTRQPCSSSSVP